ATPVPSARLPPELDFPRSVEGLAGLVGAAGLRVLEARELAWTWKTSAEDLMAGIAGGIATPGRIHRAQTPQARAGSEEDVRGRGNHWAAEGADAAVGDAANGAETVLALRVAAPDVLAVRDGRTTAGTAPGPGPDGRITRREGHLESRKSRDRQEPDRWRLRSLARKTIGFMQPDITAARPRSLRYRGYQRSEPR